VRDQIIHLDLQEVDLTVEVEADVPVILVGTPRGVREGGILDQTALTVRVRALPDALPRSIEFDVTDVGLGESVHASDLLAPGGCAIVTEAEHGIASVMLTRAALAADEEEEELEEGAAGEGAAGEGAEGEGGDSGESAESEGE